MVKERKRKTAPEWKTLPGLIYSATGSSSVTVAVVSTPGHARKDGAASPLELALSKSKPEVAIASPSALVASTCCRSSQVLSAPFFGVSCGSLCVEAGCDSLASSRANLDIGLRKDTMHTRCSSICLNGNAMSAEASSVLNVSPGSYDCSGVGVNSLMDHDGNDDDMKELSEMKKRLKEMEDEASSLREMLLTKPYEELDVAQIPSSVDFVLAQRREIDSRSVGNVDFSCTPEEVLQHLQPCGSINRVTILVDRSGRSKGYALVEFSEVEAVRQALSMNKSILHGRILRICLKRTNFPGMKRRKNVWIKAPITSSHVVQDVVLREGVG